MKPRRYFLLVMATLFAIFSLVFGLIGLACGDLQVTPQGDIAAWKPAIGCLVMAAFFFCIDMIFECTPAPIHSDDEQL